jgi:N-ethylmaleimide reductase
MMTDYYKKRSSADLIITEGTSPSRNGCGYAQIGGIFKQFQVSTGNKTIKTEHKNDGKIIVQLIQSGRIIRPLNMSKGSEILAHSAIKADGQMWTNSKKLQDLVVPKEMTLLNIIHAKTEFVCAAENEFYASFDDVELHATNGYLLEEFLSPVSNIRKSDCCGSIVNRYRFIIEVVTKIAEAIYKQSKSCETV